MRALTIKKLNRNSSEIMPLKGINSPTSKLQGAHSTTEPGSPS